MVTNMARVIKSELVSKIRTQKIDIIDQKEIFNMSLRSVPCFLRDRFNKLKSEGKITGSMNAYIKNAWLEQLKKDEH